MGGGARVARGWVSGSVLLSGWSGIVCDLALPDDDGVNRPSYSVSSSGPKFGESTGELGMSILSLILRRAHEGEERSIEAMSKVGSSCSSEPLPSLSSLQAAVMLRFLLSFAGLEVAGHVSLRDMEKMFPKIMFSKIMKNRKMFPK